jgi:XisH protein
MSAIDNCQPQVIQALEKEGWSISPRQFRVQTDDRSIFIDLKASRQMNGRQANILLAEVKCFPEGGTNPEIFLAFGQYIVYRSILNQENVSFPLYLTIPKIIFDVVFDSTIMRAVSDNRIKLVIINLDIKEVVQWIES